MKLSPAPPKLNQKDKEFYVDALSICALKLKHDNFTEVYIADDRVFYVNEEPLDILENTNKTMKGENNAE